MKRYERGTMLYGVINDDRISKVELYFEDGNILSQTEFYDDDMFLFIWDNEDRISGIKAYDSQENILFQDFQWR